MKCNELKPLVFSLNDLAYVDERAVEKNFENPHDNAVYKATEVDSAIAELKAEINRKEAVGQRWFEQCMEARTENVRLKRALWRAIALFCARSYEYFNGIMSHCLIGKEDLYRRCEEKKYKYLHAMYKCRAKMEKYK